MVADTHVVHVTAEKIVRDEIIGISVLDVIVDVAVIGEASKEIQASKTGTAVVALTVPIVGIVIIHAIEQSIRSFVVVVLVYAAAGGVVLVVVGSGGVSGVVGGVVVGGGEIVFNVVVEITIVTVAAAYTVIYAVITWTVATIHIIDVAMRVILKIIDIAIVESIDTVIDIVDAVRSGRSRIGIGKKQCRVVTAITHGVRS